MSRTMRPFFIALVGTWLALCATALFYSKQHPQSHWIMSAALPAFLFEAIFYLGAVFEETRNWFASFQPKRLQAAFLWVSAVVPYLILSVSAGTFQRNAFYILAGLTAVLAFWHALLPQRLAYDVGFLVIAAVPLAVHLFPRLYLAPDHELQIDVLGHLMWVRLGILALLVIREWRPGSFGFWPTGEEWRSGILYYLIALVPVVTVALSLHDVRYDPQHGPWWRVVGIGAGTFFGILWVVALGEDLFFFGVIARAVLQSFGSQAGAILAAAMLFGGAHLWYHGFPNWRRAAVVAVMAVPSGILYVRSNSVRGPMVAHALMVATWRVFFRS